MPTLPINWLLKNSISGAGADAFTYLDTFTDTDNTVLTSHTADTGQTWAFIKNTFKVLSNKAVSAISGAFDYAYFVTPSADVDMTVEVDIPDGDNYAGGFIFRRAASTTYWTAYIVRAGGAAPEAKIFKVTTEAAAQAYTHVFGVVTLRLVVTGNDVDFYVNGVKLIDGYTTDGSWNTDTNHGILTYQDGTFPTLTYDNFKIV